MHASLPDRYLGEHRTKKTHPRTAHHSQPVVSHSEEAVRYREACSRRAAVVPTTAASGKQTRTTVFPPPDVWQTPCNGCPVMSADEIADNKLLTMLVRFLSNTADYSSVRLPAVA